MTGVDRNFVLELLSSGKEPLEASLINAAYHSPARVMVAEERAYTLNLLLDAVAAGLLEQLHIQAHQNLLADADADAADDDDSCKTREPGRPADVEEYIGPTIVGSSTPGGGQ